jgi:hypothetical protein
LRLLRYSINVTLNGCYDHRALSLDEEMHRHHAEHLARARALLVGRVTYEMIEAGSRPLAETGVRPEWKADWMEPFARTINAAKKYVGSSTLGGRLRTHKFSLGEEGVAVAALTLPRESASSASVSCGTPAASTGITRRVWRERT